MVDYKKLILEKDITNYKNKDFVTIICDFCKKEHKIRICYLKNRMKTIWLSDIQTCNDKECMTKKHNLIMKEMAKQGCSPHQGCKVSKEQIEKCLKTKKERYPNGIENKRKGKSFIEQYGEEKASEILKKMSDFTKNSMKTKGHPMKNKHHSEESKKKMSESRAKFINSEESYVKKYKHPETGELINWHELNSANKKFSWKNLSEEEKINISEQATLRFIDREGNFIMKSKTGYVSHWFLNINQKFDSSYEEAFYKKLNNEKLFWKKNLSIYIPYIHPIINQKRFYVPDILIYSDSSFSKICKIIEVKPGKFVFNKKNYEGDYFKITKSKLDALKDYCLQNGYDCGIITEEDLGDYLEN